MRRLLTLAGTLTLFVLCCTAAAPVVNRDVLEALEIRFDKSIAGFDANDPFGLLGNTRGVYLDDYGAVFTAEVNLVAGAVMVPFRPQYTAEQKEELRRKKRERITELRSMMRDMLVDSATSLDSLPLREEIVVGVSLFYYSWEDRSDLPSQVVMQAERRHMLDFEAGRITGEALDAAISVREL